MPARHMVRVPASRHASVAAALVACAGALNAASSAGCGADGRDGRASASASSPTPAPPRASPASSASAPAASTASSPSPPAPSAGVAFEPRGALASWVGRWETEPGHGDEATASGVLEVVAVSEERAVLRVTVESGNGHQCHAAGGVRLEGEALVLRGEPGTVLEGCILRVVRDERALRLEDVDDGCRPTLCGTRAAFAHARIPRAGRRPITPDVRAELHQLDAARPTAP